MEEILLYVEKIFENIKYIDEFSQEYLRDKELAKILEYKSWNKFKRVLKRLCRLTIIVKMHFDQV